MVWENQVRQDARLVEEAAEARDEGDLLERFAYTPRARRRKDRVHAIDEQDLDRRAIRRENFRNDRLKRARWRSLRAIRHHRIRLRRKEHAAWFLHAADQRVER